MDKIKNIRNIFPWSPRVGLDKIGNNSCMNALIYWIYYIIFLYKKIHIKCLTNSKIDIFLPKNLEKKYQI